MASSRRRRRSQALMSPEGPEADVDAPQADALQPEVEPVEPQVPDVVQEMTKLQTILDNFTEEFHETTEQLPLYLHRLFALLREQDEQMAGNHTEMMNELQKYISLRRSLARPTDLGVSTNHDETEDSLVPAGRSDAFAPPKDDASVAWMSLSSSPVERRSKRTNPSPTKRPFSRPSRPMSHQDTHASSFVPSPANSIDQSATRGLLGHIATLSDSILHASHEKFNLAMTTYDSVDRHIRLLDQAIKEQETSISLGLRPGTHAMFLPEVPVPRSNRPPRAEFSPVLNLDVVTDGGIEGEPTVGLISDEPLRQKIRSGLRKGKKGSKASVTASAEPERPLSPPHSRTIKLRVPPLSTIQAGEHVDPNEPKYCYCHDVSHGEMVACDNEECLIEWFHLQCVGLSTPPPNEKPWYCRDCLASQTQTANTKRKGRQSVGA
ncbi:hypothetical protein DENSPDRAFT_843092 [Dentipellis sp. KUC8613]|nr:hypothetical protein DENSPDRAFT_843092 [Dentipellis sp. KUC8613]